VLTVSAERWALQRELSGEPEPALSLLLGRMIQVDLVLIEGFKREAHPKIEIHRLANGKPPLHPGDPTIVAVVSDAAFPGLALPLLHLNDIAGVAGIVRSCAREINEIDWC
jgi:molybdopterin-guanine dinucleotide biosynthesis adapter protein